MSLEIINVSKTYSKPLSSKKVEAVKDVSFEIKKGEIFALLGPNGAGKSTLIKMIAGLVIPSDGKILYQNKRIRTHEMCVKIGAKIVRVWHRVILDWSDVDDE